MPTKYLYLVVLQGDYGYGHGWEDLCAADDTAEGWREIRANRREYRENAPEYVYRIIQRRELRQEA
jgi:hypothetical protein